MVLEIKSKNQLDNQLQEAVDKLVVIDFFASWCGPCKQIGPKIDEFSREFTDVVFLKVEVDECEDLTMEFNISSLPTFILMKNTRTLEKIVGANAEKIRATIMKHKA